MKDRVVPTSISLSQMDVDWIKAQAETLGESDALVGRQLLRIAIRRGWTAESLRLASMFRDMTGERVIFRLAPSPGQMEAVNALRGDFPLAVFVRAVLHRVRELDELGSTDVWALK